MKRSPMKRKPAKRRPRAAVPCSGSPRCRKRPEIVLSEAERLCKGHAVDLADRLVGDFVRARDGRCMLTEAAPDAPCSGDRLFWCHLIPKGAHPAIRWEPLNAVAACNTHHMAFDRSEVFRDFWRDKHLGPELNAELKRRSVAPKARPNVGDVIAEYRAKAAA